MRCSHTIDFDFSLPYLIGESIRKVEEKKGQKGKLGPIGLNELQLGLIGLNELQGPYIIGPSRRVGLSYVWIGFVIIYQRSRAQTRP